MKIRLGILLAVITIFTAGCAQMQTPVSLTNDAIISNSGRIGVAMTPLPKPDTYFPGANCLLCIAAASVANSSLTAHAKTLQHEDLPNLKNEVANLLRKKGANVVVIAEELDVLALPSSEMRELNYARKDFSSLRQKHNIDKVLVFQIGELGFVRNYSAYIPASDPKSLLNGVGYIIDLKTNKYDWYQPIMISTSASRNWDEPPKFPGLTNAYFQTIELGKDRFLQPFNTDAVPATAAAAKLK